MSEAASEARSDAEMALAALREVGAVLEGHFQYASGRHGPLYIEKFRLLERPEVTAQLCAQIAAHFADEQIELVVGPTTGGILLAHETARNLNTPMFFAEPNPQGGRIFERGFTFQPAQRTLIVDDVLTTGGSIRDTIEAVHRAGGQPAAVGVVVDRTNGASAPNNKFEHLPFFACIPLDVPSYAAADCPLCAAGGTPTET